MVSTKILYFLIGLVGLPRNVSSDDEFKDYQSAGLREHNRYRAYHNVSALTMLDGWNSEAEQWAGMSIKDGTIYKFGGESGDPNIIEHFFSNVYTTPNDDRDFYGHVLAACDQWYAQCRRVNSTRDQFTNEIRDFAIMVSPAMKYLGISVAYDDKTKTILVYARYGAGCAGGKIGMPKVTPCTVASSSPQHLLYSIPILLLEVAILTKSLTNFT